MDRPRTAPPPVRLERLGPVAVVTLHRPQVRNAIDLATAELIEEHVEQIESDDTIEAAVIAADGPTFCAGSDLKAKARGEPRPVTESGGFAGLVYLRRTKPFVAAVGGDALGGGFEIVLACDLVVASTSARFSLPEITHGIVAGGGGLFRLPRRLPFAVAGEVILAGRVLSADEALGWGLVNAVVPHDQVRDRAVELAASLCGDRSLAVRESLRVMHSAENRRDAGLWELTERASMVTQSSPQGRRGVQAFAGAHRSSTGTEPA